MGVTYYTSDLHIGDTRIIRLCSRPHRDLNDMRDDIRDRWNSTVSKKDEVYLLGDVAFGYRKSVIEYISTLNGKKHLIIGNHDKGWMIREDPHDCFHSVSHIKTIKDEGRSVSLCHYPMYAYEGSTKNGYHVYGHVHNNTKEPNYAELKNTKRIFNAGVDVNDFRPVTLNELIEKHMST